MTEGDAPGLPPWLGITAVGPANAPGERAVLSAVTARSRVDLFATLVDALGLPGYVGRNWDALADSLRDRLDAGPLTLVVDDATQLLADEPVGHLGLLLAVLGDAAGDAPHPLRVVLRDAPDRVPDLRRRTARALPRR
ncbi:barnase inhibitor [Micromonospora sp. KC207]|uniref:barstar family protein n=1 Tax=Micromonospora sp. KC207 TaxID=2530377 RepID=UPI0010466098|nr:barstar family protein [Micromonospora sp. KC207]TDC59411.1 barnase inhibitor [Micromonospora sp. KC207]